MNLDLQFKISSNENYKNYLREHSYWYKVLNRDPGKFNDFVDEVKERYKLRTTDKLSDLADKMEMIQMVLNVLR